jgi:hypothetical protein
MTSPLTKNVQNCCLTVSVAISLRQNWCQGDDHLPRSDRHSTVCEAPWPLLGMNGAKNLKGTLIIFLSKCEYLSSRSGLSYIFPTQVTFLDIMAVKFYNFVRMQKITSDFFVLRYLRTLFQLGRIGRMSRKCGKNRVQ